MTKDYLEKGQKILDKYGIKTKNISTIKEIQQAKHFSAIIISEKKLIVK